MKCLSFPLWESLGHGSNLKITLFVGIMFSWKNPARIGMGETALGKC